MRATDKVEVFCGFCDKLYETYYQTTIIAKSEGRPTFCCISCYWKYADANTPDQYYIDKFWDCVDKSPNLGPTGECWLWKGPVHKSYPSMHIRGARKIATHVAHWIKTGHMPDTSKGEMMLHDCDFPMCVRHLTLGDHKKNMSDMVARGRNSRGSKVEAAKLNEEEALLIRAMYFVGGRTQEFIANFFNVNKGTVAKIVRGKSWKHVPTVQKMEGLAQLK